MLGLGLIYASKSSPWYVEVIIGVGGVRLVN